MPERPGGSGSAPDSDENQDDSHVKEVGGESVDEQEQAGEAFVPTPEQALDPGMHMEAHQEVGTIVVVGGPIGTGKADAGLVGELLTRVAATIHQIGLRLMRPSDWVARPQIDQVSFASAHIRFIVGDGESMRLDDQGSPTLDAAQRFTELMIADDQEQLLALAVESGEEGARAYKSFLKLVAENELDVKWTNFKQESVEIDSTRALRDFMILDLEGQEQRQELQIAGHLSMADSDVHAFALRLPKGAPRPPELKGRRKIRGTLPEHIAAQLKAENLWDRDVLATVRIVREVEGTAATPREPTFEMTTVQSVEQPSDRTTSEEADTADELF